MRRALLISALLSTSLFALDRRGDPTTPSEIRRYAAEINARDLPFDYSGVVNRALAKDTRALGELFHFLRSPRCDGVMAEQHCVILRGLMIVWGDRAFARALRHETPKLRDRVLGALEFADPRYSKSFPRTASLAVPAR
jgi:hypothetical protein